MKQACASMLSVLAAAGMLAACSSKGTVATRDSLEPPKDAAADEGGALPDAAPESVPDTAPDAAPDSGWDFGTDEAEAGTCAAGQGCFGDPCKENTDCQSGFCVEHMGEGTCSQECSEECPQGWTCKQAGEGPDVSFICVSNHAGLCKPCAANADCKGVGGTEDVCVDYGKEGSFCGGMCKFDADCPWGFSCKEVPTVTGLKTEQCVADAGVCPCTEKSIELGLFTPCSVTNDFGTCPGQRTCVAEGLSECSAPAAVQETCNGLDDDCDGETDEPIVVPDGYLALCEDGNDCTEDLCKGTGGCEQVALAGVECKDGDPCTIADTCQQGVCAGTPVKCDDYSDCTDDSCAETGGCVFVANAASCDDGDPCTVADACKDKVCAGYPVDCDCQTDKECAALEDGNACNGTLYCNVEKVPHLCQVAPGSVVTCPPPEGKNALCLSAVCDPETGKCGNVPGADGLLCDDGDACTVSDKCVSGQCLAGMPANCNDGNPCTDDICNPNQGCVALPNATACNDGNACTAGDQCSLGECQGGPPLACDDGNLCTDDACDPAAGCTHAAGEAGCDDGNACTLGDHCAAGSCVSDGTLICDDKSPCTKDSCHPISGCVVAAQDGACSDGNPCTINDYCSKGKCVPGPAVFCDDGNPCTDDSCGANGLCAHVANAAACDDGNACTTGDACSDGKCGHAGLVTCEDDNPCTTDVCDPAAGCKYTLNQSPCDDGDVCTLGDLCSQGECGHAGALDCDDGNPCTDDSCDPAAGCKHTPNQAGCDDDNFCTLEDKCQAGKCKGTKPKPCDDANVCTDDWCDPESGCLHKANTAPCDDGSKCTTGDACKSGSCTGGKPIDCNDGNPCTDDSCAPATGCTHSANAAPCSDGNPCTDGDVCAALACAPGPPLTCNDANLCTDDSCDAGKGCVYAPNIAACEDGNVCTATDKCAGGMCQPGPPVSCNDNNLCTDDSCSPANGCVFLPNVNPCSDGSLCTNGDVCKNGGCWPGPTLNCDDANPCTTDACAPAAGCTHTPLANGTDCGGGKTCLDGACTNCPNPHGTQTFSYTGGQQSFTVPLCVTSITIEVWGAQGGGSDCCGGGTQDDGGKGGYAKGTLTVTPGQTLYVYVGGKGQTAGAGGWNGGGSGSQFGGGGGGASDVRTGGTSFNERVIVGGAGGAGNCGCPDHGAGGYGGGLTGGTGISNQGWTPAGGGTQNAGGSAGSNCSPGTFGNGGSNASYHMAGGGGGWYGGGCAYAAGGGGGSSYYGNLANGSTQSNLWTGHGKVTLTW